MSLDIVNYTPMIRILNNMSLNSLFPRVHKQYCLHEME